MYEDNQMCQTYLKKLLRVNFEYYKRCKPTNLFKENYHKHTIENKMLSNLKLVYDIQFSITI